MSFNTGIIVLLALTATVNCRPQLRLHNPSISAFQPQPHHNVVLNAAPTSTQNLELHQRNQKLTLKDKEAADYEDYQNQNARYEFSSNIEDHINDLTHQREEIREGGSVKGSYSYSDGYYKRTVSYIADENGYRVTGMDAVPLDGPHIDLSGTASVSNSAHGNAIRYKVASVPVPGPVSKIVQQ